MPESAEAAAIAAELRRQHPDERFTHVNSGKVREIYEKEGGHNLVLASTDRISAFDVPMDDRIPNKGAVLNSLSAFWFSSLRDVVPHHLWKPDYLPGGAFAGRASLVERLTPIPAECIVRALITGSMWSAFQEADEVDGVKDVLGFELPATLQESEKFPDPLFTPSTKAEVGHDQNLSQADTRTLLDEWLRGLPENVRAEWTGDSLFEELERISLALFARGSEYAAERGIILADTKFEFGLSTSGKIVIMDEIFTPDSSRFVFEEDYVVGQKLVCRDKQILRDYLQGLVDDEQWDKEYPPPPLPQHLIDKLEQVYLDIYQRLLGHPLELAA